MSTPNRPLRIAVADDRAACRIYQEWLPSLGHQVVAVAHTGRELIDRCGAERPDLVIAELDLPGMDGIVASVEVNRGEHQVPFILVSARQGAEILARVGVDHIMAYLTKPVKPADLAAAIHLAVLRFGHFRTVMQEAADLRQALADRKVIERAKGALMKRSRLDEADAFRRLQRLANAQNRKLLDIAREVLVAEETFRELDEGQSAPDR